jgi:hypothetical protein
MERDMRFDPANRGRSAARSVVLLVVLMVAFASACGGGDDEGLESQTNPDGVPTSVDERDDDAGRGTASGCPFTATALAEEVGQTWTQRGPTSGEIPWLDGVPAVSCAYGSEAVDADGDSLFIIRTDVVTADHVDTVRDDFVDSCEDSGGSIRSSSAASGASWCEQDGLVETGVVERSGELVHVSIVNDDDGSLGRSIEAILGLV